VKLLFGKRDTDHCQALNKLKMCIRDTPRELMSVTDLVLKWTTVRMCLRDNTSAIQAMQTFLKAFFQMLIDHAYELADFEAHSFLPFLVEKVGHRSDRFRTSYRNMFSQLRELYPIAKMAQFMIDSVHSKNVKTHCECLEELGVWIQDSGGNWKICGRRGIQTVTKKCGSKDVATRNAAIGIVYHVWKHFDFNWESLKRVVGDLTPKLKSLMQEKFRTLKLQDQSKGSTGMKQISKLMATPNTIRGGGARAREDASVNMCDTASTKINATSAVEKEFGDLFTLDMVTLSPATRPSKSDNDDSSTQSDTKVIETPRNGTSSKSITFSVEKSSVLKPAAMLDVALGHMQELPPLYNSITENIRVEVAQPSVHSRGVTAIKLIVDMAQIAIAADSAEENSLNFDADEVVRVICENETDQGKIMKTLLDCVQAAVGSPAILDFRMLSLVMSALMKLFDVVPFAKHTTTQQMQQWLSIMVTLLTSPKINARNTTDDALCRAVNYLTVKMVAQAPLHTTLSAAYGLLSQRSDASPSSSQHSILLKVLEKVFKEQDALILGTNSGHRPYDNVDVAALVRDMHTVTPHRDEGCFANSIAEDVARTMFRNVLRSTCSLPSTGEGNVLIQASERQLPASSVLAHLIQDLQAEIIEAAPKAIGVEGFQSKVREIVEGMLTTKDAQKQRVHLRDLHKLRLDHASHSISEALKTCSIEEPFQVYVVSELKCLAEKEAQTDPGHTVRQGSLSLQSRLAKMRAKYQLSNGTTSILAASQCEASKENGAGMMTGDFISSQNGHQDRIGKESGVATMSSGASNRISQQSRESLSVMRARLQKIQMGATPRKKKTFVGSKSIAGGSIQKSGNKGSTSRTTVNNLKHRLEMYKKKTLH
jgi:hypothetical protein